MIDLPRPDLQYWFRKYYKLQLLAMHNKLNHLASFLAFIARLQLPFSIGTYFVFAPVSITIQFMVHGRKFFYNGLLLGFPTFLKPMILVEEKELPRV